MASDSIIVIDSDETLRHLVHEALSPEGYTVRCVTSLEKGLAQIYVGSPGLIILGVAIPASDKLDACRQLTMNGRQGRIPLLVISEEGEEADIVASLTLGADDYLSLPVSPRLLVARVKAILRRHPPTSSGTLGTITTGELTIDPAKHAAYLDGVPLALTTTEFHLLYILASNRDTVCSRPFLIRAVKGDAGKVTKRWVDVQILGLRNKLGHFAHHVETVRGLGYRFQHGD